MIKYKKIFENNDFLVINKPAGLLTHDADHIKELTLVDQLLKKYPRLAQVGESPERPGLAHRLDRLVSGLLVIAKNQESFEHLKKQFQNRTVEKHYTALVHGRIDQDEGRINFPVRRSRQGYKMAAIPLTVKGEKNVSGRNAITEFMILKKFVNYTLLKIQIKTGRMHQIRVHIAAYGHPVVGDDLYGTKKTKLKNQKLNLARIFLVADELSFVDLHGKQQTFKINLPNDLRKFLNQIK